MRTCAAADGACAERRVYGSLSRASEKQLACKGQGAKRGRRVSVCDVCVRARAHMHPICPNTTHHCPTANVTVLKIVGGTPDAAFGNLFYSAVPNGVLYAQRRGYAGVWVDFEPSVVNMTMGDRWAREGPLWERFFQPFCPNISAWVRACPSTVSVLVKRRNFWWASRIFGSKSACPPGCPGCHC